MIKVIKSKENARIKFALSLKEAKVRKKEHLFLAESKKSLEMALKNNLLVETFSLQNLSLSEDITQNIVSEEILKKIASSVNPEVVFIAKEINLSIKKDGRLIYLDHINDPGNMGTIIRTALAFNYDGIILSDDCVSIYNDKVIAASKGALFEMPIVKEDIHQYLNHHQIIVSTLNDDSVNLKDCPIQDKLILVLGNESHGVSAEIMALATHLVKIPIQNIDSLNVGVAGGILMYYFCEAIKDE